MPKSENLTVEDLRRAIEGEGLEYAVRYYYGRSALETIEDDDIRIAAIMAYDACETLEKLIGPEYV